MTDITMTQTTTIVEYRLEPPEACVGWAGKTYSIDRLTHTVASDGEDSWMAYGRVVNAKGTLVGLEGWRALPPSEIGRLVELIRIGLKAARDLGAQSA